MPEFIDPFIPGNVYMNIRLNINNTSCVFSDSRMSRMLSGDRETATCMGWWDKFKDFFREEKKAEVLEQLYNLLYPDEGSIGNTENELPWAVNEHDRINYIRCCTAFTLLQQLATPDSQSVFTKDVGLTDESILNVNFSIHQQIIKTLQIPVYEYHDHGTEQKEYNVALSGIDNAVTQHKPLQKLDVRQDGYCLFRCALVKQTGDERWAMQASSQEVRTTLLSLYNDTVAHCITTARELLAPQFDNPLLQHYFSAPALVENMIHDTFTPDSCLLWSPRGVCVAIDPYLDFDTLTEHDRDTLELVINAIYTQLPTAQHLNISTDATDSEPHAELMNHHYTWYR